MADKNAPEELTIEQRAAKLPFDEALSLKFKDAIQKALVDHPELRSVTAVFDYAGNLNDSAIHAGVWQGESGPASSPGEIVGSVQQMYKILSVQLARMQKFSDGLREELTIVGQELVKRKQELAEHERKEGTPG